MGSRKLARDFFLFKHQLSASRQIPNEYSRLQKAVPSNVIRREFCVFSEFSEKIKEKIERNHKLPQFLKEIKDKPEGLKVMELDLKARIKQTTKQPYKHVDAVLMEAEAKVKQMKESAGVGKNMAIESNGTSRIGDKLKEAKPVGMVKKGHDIVDNDLKDIPIKGNEMHHNTTLRPLSPHLTIYKPQQTSISSISFRISGILLVTSVVSFYLVYMKVGFICFTYENMYQILFYLSKLLPISAMIISLALSYHIFHGMHHILPWFTWLKNAVLPLKNKVQGHSVSNASKL